MSHSLVRVKDCRRHEPPPCPWHIIGLPFSQVQQPSTTMPLTVFHNPLILMIYHGGGGKAFTTHLPHSHHMSSPWLPSLRVGRISQWSTAHVNDEPQLPAACAGGMSQQPVMHLTFASQLSGSHTAVCSLCQRNYTAVSVTRGRCFSPEWCTHWQHFHTFTINTRPLVPYCLPPYQYRDTLY